MVHFIALVCLLKFASGQVVQNGNQLSKFSATTCQSYQSVCASSKANKSYSVRSKGQCLHECRRGVKTACVGVNYQQMSKICEIYQQCPTSYATNMTGCQFMQREAVAGQSTCAVSVGVSLSQNQYVPSRNCSYPFTYNGTVYYNCMTTETRPEFCGLKACLMSSRQFALCFPPDDYQAQTISRNLTVSPMSAVTVQSVFGWIVIQQRVPTSGTPYDWQQSWVTYKNGFGDSSSNFWLGLERMNSMTTAASFQLRFEVQQDTTGLWFSAEYSSFTVGPESSEQYKLTVSGYSGDAGDSLQYSSDWNGDGHDGWYYNNGMKFTTRDRDNDKSSSYNCATDRGGGWWYYHCYCACPTCDDNHAEWCTLSTSIKTRATRMMMKINN